MTENARRLRVALGILHRQLSAGGDDFEALTPMHPELTARCARLAAAAYLGEPSDDLDPFVDDWEFPD